MRPFLEYNSIIWAPFIKKNEEKIEKVQKKALKLIYDLRHFSYQEKLKRTKLFSLHARRIEQQLTILFKMKSRKIDLKLDSFFQENLYNQTRGNAYKLRIPKTKTKIRQKFFTSSIVKYWNLLKSSDINVKTDKAFKEKVKNFFIREKRW